MKVATRTPARKKSPADYRSGAEVFKALANGSRLLILDALRDGERCVAELTAMVGLDMSTVSNHLAVLRGVGMVRDERRGTQVFYTIGNPCVLKVFACLTEFEAAGAKDGRP